MKGPTTRDMSDRHEQDLQRLLGGVITRGSGNQSRSPMDVRQSRHEIDWAFAFDGKSTLSRSMSVGLDMWDKAVEQSHGERTGLPLRFYDGPRLRVVRDLIVIDLHDFAELVEQVRR